MQLRAELRRPSSKPRRRLSPYLASASSASIVSAGSAAEAATAALKSTPSQRSPENPETGGRLVLGTSGWHVSRFLVVDLSVSCFGLVLGF